MNEEDFNATITEIREFRMAIATVHEALKDGDGREVKAACAELAVKCFALGQAAEKRSEQRFLA